MKYALNASQMKALDNYTIQTLMVPSMVLMERAALAVADRVKLKADKKDKILSVCGTGNNGGDGIAAARILYAWGYQAEILLLGEREKLTDESKRQLRIAEEYGLSIRTECDFSEYNIMIDSIFGIGLNKPITDMYRTLIKRMNQSGSYIVAVDIPSGVSANNGDILGIAVKADETVTFGENKIGILMYPGKEYCGIVTVADIGFPAYENVLSQGTEIPFITYDESDLSRLPVRKDYSNKGTYGRVLVIAGSQYVTGAAYLSALAAYRTGAGLVKVLTAQAAIPVIQSMLPEALTAAYDGGDGIEQIEKSLDWASVVLMGPGLGTDERARKLTAIVIRNVKVPLILDADALNVLAGKLDQASVPKEERIAHLEEILPKGTILTPHLKEFSRLSLESLNKFPSYLIDNASLNPYNCKLTYVVKDTRTIVSSRNLRYLNTSGNQGMATGGSGDVLAGVIAGLIAVGKTEQEAATLGVYIHGLAGDVAAKQLGAPSMLAHDIINALSEVFRSHEGRRV